MVSRFPAAPQPAMRPLLSALLLIAAVPLVAPFSPAARAQTAAGAAPQSGTPAAHVKPGEDAFLRGMQAKSKRLIPLVLKEFAEAADAGHADAQHLLGLIHLRGDGVKMDPAHSVTWFERALQ